MPPQSQKKVDPDQPSMKNTKKELLDAYHEVLQQLEEKDRTQLKPEQKAQEKKDAQVLTAVREVSADGVLLKINQLKQEMLKTLADLSDKLTAEVQKYDQVQQAIEIKQKELKEIFEIERSAGTLAALIEAQHLEREQFERRMAEEKEDLTEEIAQIREKWEREKAERDAEAKEQQANEAKRRKREEEEYRYAFEREKQLARDKFEDEKVKLTAQKAELENQMQTLREQTEKELGEREKRIAEREDEFAALRSQVETFPERLDAAVADAAKETTARMQREAKYERDLIQKDFEGQKNVLTARIESLEKTVKEQAEQISKLSHQQEGAYQKIQDVAVKAIEGASKLGSFGSLAHTLKEQARRQSEED